MNRLDEIVRKFPVRKSEEQKDSFLRWAQTIAGNAGIVARTEENGKHHNFVAGDPDTARVIFTAHYDTPANMILPNLIIPRNLPLFFGYCIWYLQTNRGAAIRSDRLFCCLLCFPYSDADGASQSQ